MVKLRDAINAMLGRERASAPLAVTYTVTATDGTTSQITEVSPTPSPETVAKYVPPRKSRRFDPEQGRDWLESRISGEREKRINWPKAMEKFEVDWEAISGSSDPFWKTEEQLKLEAFALEPVSADDASQRVLDAGRELYPFYIEGDVLYAETEMPCGSWINSTVHDQHLWVSDGGYLHMCKGDHSRTYWSPGLV